MGAPGRLYSNHALTITPEITALARARGNYHFAERRERERERAADTLWTDKEGDK